MNTRLLFIHALSPIHAGTGQSVGAIDLAIARETATGVPYIPGSSIKGVIRDRFNTENSKEAIKLFGPTTENASDHAGSVHFADARLLFLPVRSLAGTFAYVTSPYLLQTLARDANETGLLIPIKGLHPKNGQCLIPDNSSLKASDKVVLEDLDFMPSVNKAADDLAQQIAPLIFGSNSNNDEGKEVFPTRLCIVEDDVMSFLMEHATEVRARIRLEPDTKTVAKGALWYEESLPTETVLVSMVVAAPAKAAGLTANECLTRLAGGIGGMIQLGGNATVGQGFCRINIVGGAA